MKARFLITYQITLPGVSASHVWRAWDRPNSTTCAASTRTLPACRTPSSPNGRWNPLLQTAKV